MHSFDNSIVFMTLLNRDAAVSHALDVRKAIQFDNYHKFFKLYKCTPNLGVCILDLLVDNCRLQALQRICKGSVFSHFKHRNLYD